MQFGFDSSETRNVTIDALVDVVVMRSRAASRVPVTASSGSHVLDHRRRQIDDHVGVRAHDASGVLGALEIAGSPVQLLGNTRQQRHG